MNNHQLCSLQDTIGSQVMAYPKGANPYLFVPNAILYISLLRNISQLIPLML
jgi:hypothetical protein